MTIQITLLLIALSLLLGLLTSKWQRTNLLMVTSVILMYWLQPETNLRYLGFWLPAFSLFLVILSWAVTSPLETRKSPGTLSSLFIVIALVSILSLIDWLDPNQLLGFNRSPGIISLLAYLAFIALSAYFLLSIKPKDYGWPWVAFILLLVIFIVLKAPPLTLQASTLWRALSGQSRELATASELQWLGYSYLAFRLLHTIRDKQAGRLPSLALNEYIAYAVFFPAFIAGPIAKTGKWLEGLRNISASFSQNLLEGSQRIVIGLFKKYVLADSLAVFALNAQNANQVLTSSGAWILLYAYSLQIYLDFSGYTDIAIGMARFLGIHLAENFNKPYLKPNLTQFWSNWHMTLTNWFRSYFFNPISRNMRKNKVPAWIILLITQISTMVLVGLWHGITLNFILWGIWHGLGLLIQNRWSSLIRGILQIHDLPPSPQKILDSLGVVLTFHYVTLGWVWFVLPTPGAAWQYLSNLFGFGL